MTDSMHFISWNCPVEVSRVITACLAGLFLSVLLWFYIGLCVF